MAKRIGKKKEIIASFIQLAESAIAVIEVIYWERVI